MSQFYLLPFLGPRFERDMLVEALKSFIDVAGPPAKLVLIAGTFSFSADVLTLTIQRKFRPRFIPEQQKITSRIVPLNVPRGLAKDWVEG